MQRRTVFALFCEDIRPEAGNTVSLTGILPDTVNFVTSDAANDAPKGNEIETRLLSNKLCVYVRINFDLDDEFPEPQMTLVFGGRTYDVGKIESKTIATARQSARENGNVQAGVFARVVLGGLTIGATGDASLEVAIGDEKYLAGAVRFLHRQAALTSPNASPPPS